MKNPLLKCFLYFRKLKFSTPSLKTPIFLGEPLRVFHHCFFRCFHFTIDFYYLFWVFSLLIAFVHFITVSLCVFFFSPLILLLFFECFHFTKFLYRDCFLSGTSFLCCCTANATDLRELFFTLRRSLPYTASRNLAQPAFIKASLGPTIQPSRLQGLPLMFETQTGSNCLFESHCSANGICR